MKSGILQSHSSLITFCNQTLDLVVIPLGLWLSVYLLGTELYIYPLIIGGGLATLAFQFLASIRGLYLSQRGESTSTEISKCIKYWTVAYLVAIGVLYNLPSVSHSLSYASIFWGACVSVYFICSRLFIRQLLKYIRKKGYNQRNVVIVGSGDVGIKLANNMFNSPEHGLNIVGFYDDSMSGTVKTDEGVFDVLGNLNDLVNDAKSMDIDRIYITLSMRHMGYIKQIVTALSDSTCSVVFVPDMFAFDLLNARMGHLNGIPTISIYDTPMEGANRLVKRIEDFVLSAIILLIISPVLLIIAALIKITSPGPVFFKQDRYGIDGKPIKVWKFRSMTAMDNGNNVVQASKGDARITPLGGFLRKTSLDELPQFINALQGSMSIVGPRPHAVAHNEEYRQIIDGYMLRHKVKPGITGWAQINGWRGETDTLEKMEKRIEFDLKYINNWTLIWDLKIIFLTIFKGFINKNAY
jgi:putative colanic acid biosynthesis UDP-glucose lipid carrier transferase